MTNMWNGIEHFIQILRLLAVLNVFYDNMFLGPVWVYRAIMRWFFTVTRRAT